MAIAIKFAGMAIEGVQRWTPSRKNKVADLTIPRRHGTITPEVSFSDKLTLTLSGEVWRNSASEIRDYFDILGATFFNAGKDRLEFLDDGRFVRALCTGTAFADIDTSAPNLRGSFSIEFTCGDPFWYRQTESSSLRDTENDGLTYSVTNNGPVRTPVRLEIHALGCDIADLKVTNSTTGLFMHFSGTVLENTSLIIDSAKYSCENNGANSLNQFDGDFFPLEPGLNNLVFDGGKSIIFKSGPPYHSLFNLYWSERFIH